MKKFLVALMSVAAYANNEWTQFNQFMVDYDRVYESAIQMKYRFEVFSDNVRKIAIKNAEHVAIGGGEVFGINSFADMTHEEFSQRLMKDLPERAPSKLEITPKPAGTYTVDWRTKGVVTAVKDQGQCGSCWAHSADEAFESFYAINYGLNSTSIKTFSVQQCTACTYTYNGCNGGWPHDAYPNAIEKRNGIDLDSDYPYNIAQAGNCKFGATGDADKPAGDTIVNNTPFLSPAKGTMQSVLDYNVPTKNQGPLSVCVAAESWQYYTTGILKSCPGQVDHCVQAVGFNNAAPETYWIVRNSWGTGWGNAGYIYLDMSTDSGDICHIQEYMTSPLIQ
jgi:Pyruvate/2-oxoacid:ferredoxin oxidoreductase delta subunit